MIAEDFYLAKAVEWAFGRTSAGDLIIGIMFAISVGELRGHRAQWTGFLTDRPDRDGVPSKDKVFEVMRRCGWGGDPGDLSGLGANTVQIKVKHKEWNGKKYAEVAFVNALPRVRVQGAIPEAQWVSVLVAASRQRPAFDPTAPEQPEAFQDDESTPFD